MSAGSHAGSRYPETQIRGVPGVTALSVRTAEAGAGPGRPGPCLRRYFLSVVTWVSRTGWNA